MKKKSTHKKRKAKAKILENTIAELNPFKLPPNENEEMFRMLASVSNDMIHVCNRDGKILYANPATERLLGYPPGQLINTSAEKLIHPDDQEVIRRDKELFLARGKPVPAREIRLIRNDGTYISVSRVEKLLDSGGKEKYTGLVIRNTTIIKTSARH